MVNSSNKGSKSLQKRSISLDFLEGSIDEFDENVVRMWDEAQRLWPLAYAPYSGFHVVAVVLTSEGGVLAGTNQENASFPVGICAERVVLSALSCQVPLSRVQAMLVFAARFTNNHGFVMPVDPKPVAPCGMCRQALMEQIKRQNHDFPLYLASSGGTIWCLERASDLLPLAFRDF
ncbi:MAG: cytidine deaminase family protein [Bacteroidia bacterium]|jgi:cytidine deaminase